MILTIVLVLGTAFIAWTASGYITHNAFDHQKGSRALAYFIAIVIVIAVSGLIGLGINVPDRSGLETATRAFLVILPATLLGVRMALGRKPAH